VPRASKPNPSGPSVDPAWWAERTASIDDVHAVELRTIAVVTYPLVDKT
jgi:hypothetical protein